MTRFYPGSDITLLLEHKDSTGTLVNADTVTLEYKLNTEDSATATPTNTATGTYATVVTPKKPGVLRYKWKITEDSVTKVKQGKIKVHDSEFVEA